MFTGSPDFLPYLDGIYIFLSLEEIWCGNKSEFTHGLLPHSFLSSATPERGQMNPVLL